MNRLKLILSGVALFTVVGGALAFKCYHTITFYTLNSTNTKCNVSAALHFTTSNPTKNINYTLTSQEGTSGDAAHPCWTTAVADDAL